MTTDGISRETFFGMAGLTENSVDAEAYTPVSLGKGNKYRNGNASWIANLRRIDFTDADGLRRLTPENVTATDVFVNGIKQSKYKAIVGDNTGEVYSIKSKKYEIAQNQLIVESLADVSDSTGIQVFGRMNDEGGRMSINAFFADPSCNVDFGNAHGQKDPYMLGVRAYNSHLGDRGFGAEIVGVRYLCSNLFSFGEVLGRVSWKHFVTEDKVVDLISSMIRSYMDKVPALKDRIEAMNNEILTLDEAECALWGIKVSPFKTEGIMTNFKELNPEIVGKNGKVSVYDVYNASSAYNTYANTGGSEFGRNDFNHKVQNLITKDIARLIDDGAEARRKYQESLLKMTKDNTTIVAY